MGSASAEAPTVRRLTITVRGVVQGVGFRPFVYNTARSLGLAGWVQNEADMVRIEIEGSHSALDGFLELLRRRHPPQARIDSLDVAELPPQDGEEATGPFQIRASAGGAAPQPTIPADLATCAECLAEIRDPAERRHQYPFTNCTSCGPRWSIIRHLPYDRPRTSMVEFEMCPECRAEYEDPADRRFHAQPIACPKCGPALQVLGPTERTGAGTSLRPEPTPALSQLAVGPAALDRAAQAVLAGQVVAVKGLGGFQLLVDATNEQAVALLRRRKHRPDRPFALMFPSLDAVREDCEVSEEEGRRLASHEAPILLLRRRGRASDHGTPTTDRDSRTTSITEAAAPGNPYLGAMLPYTPLHHWLMERIGRPIVCTSGNLSEEPMAISTEDALQRLGPIADLLLTHNRPIVRPVDDSVARIGPDGFQVLRRARGYAPLPVTLRFPAPTILAVGGHLKNTVALAVGQVSNLSSHDRLRTCPATPVILSAHIGDLESVLSVDVFRRAIDDLVEFFQVTPEVVACDLHPDYASTRHAEELAARWGVPLVRVQHHHAHVAACMAEHALEGPVLGLSWDGTGYGTDGTVWGGEALVCEGGEFRRIAHLRTFALVGGDRAVREPRRSALGVLFEIENRDRWSRTCGETGPDQAGATAGGGEIIATSGRGLFTDTELKTLLSLLSRGLHAPRTSSMGRLFDAVAVLCGLPRVISFEGQAAMALEFAADPAEQDAYPLPLTPGPACRAGPAAECALEQRVLLGNTDAQPKSRRDDSTVIADWEPLVRAVLADRAAGLPIGRIASRFHNALAELALATARHAAIHDIVLTGGCFQNALLAERVRSRLLAADFSVYTHHTVPPGDGGIALGQVFVAARQAQGSHHVSGNSR